MRRSVQGYSYILVLFAVAFLGAGLGMAGELWRVQAQREREEQLLWTGHQYRRAIEAYWRATGGNAAAGAAGTPAATGAPPSVGGPAPGTPGAPAGAGRYPPSLDALLVDPRFQQIRRYLRKRYPDPMTGKDDWVAMTSPTGGIMGVHSVSETAPIKVAGFSPADIAFTGKTHYSEWTFVFVPKQPQRPGAGAGTSPAATPATGGAPGLPAVPPFGKDR